MRAIGQKQKKTWFMEELRRLRYKIYMTQAEFCRRAHIPLGTYKAWECGVQLPSPKNWEKYLRYMSKRFGEDDLKLIKEEYINSKGA